MKKIWGLVLGVLLIAGCHTSKRSVLYQIADENQPVNWTSLSYQYPGEEGVYVFYNQTIAHDLKPDFKINAPRWYFFESHHWKEAILQDRTGEDASAFEVELASNQELRVAQIRIVDSNGMESSYSRRDLERENAGGDSTRFRLANVYLEEGATIEAVYEVESRDLYDMPPLSHDVAFQQDRPMLSYAFDFVYPREWDIQVKRVGFDRTIEMAESRQEREETTSLHYTAERVPAFNSQNYRPYYKEVAPYFHVRLREFEVGTLLAYRAPEEWERIASRYQPYTADYSRKVTGRAEEVWQSLGVNVGAPAEERIAAVMNHVENDISFSSHPSPSEVAKEGHGNAYAITAYTKALLKEAGVSADYMIAHSAEGGYFDDDFISHEQLYMPLLRVQHAGRPLHLFPALRGVPAGYIPPEYERQPALMFEGGDYKGVRPLNGMQRAAYADHGDYQVFIDFDGRVRVKTALELGQYSAYRFNQQLREAGGDELGNLAKALLPHESRQISAFVYRVEEAGFNEPMRLIADYELDGCLEQVGDDYTLHSCGLFEPATESWYPFAQDRPTAFQLPAETSLSNRVSVTYPSQWTLVTEVSELSESSRQGRLERSVSTGEGTLEVEQRLSLNKQLLEPMTLASTFDAFRMSSTTRLPFIELSNSVWASTDLGEIEKGGPWTLVVGSYDSATEAEKSLNNYQKNVNTKGYDTTILSSEEMPRKYRVVVGTFATRSSVETALHMLGEEIPFDTWMLSLKKPLTASTGDTEPVRH